MVGLCCVSTSHTGHRQLETDVAECWRGPRQCACRLPERRVSSGSMPAVSEKMCSVTHPQLSTSLHLLSLTSSCPHYRTIYS